MLVEYIKHGDIHWAEFNSYVEISAKVDGVKMEYRVGFKFLHGVIKFEKVAYKTTRQRNYRYIEFGRDFRGTFEEKKKHFEELMKSFIPQEIINSSLKHVINSITISEWTGEI